MTTANVLFVDQSAEMGGGELSLFDLARLWPAKAKVVLFDDGRFREKLQHAGVAVAVLRPEQGVGRLRRGSGLLGALRGVPALIRTAFKLAKEARQFDLVYANSQKAFLIAAVAACLARRPCIWHLRDILSREHFSGFAVNVAVFLANALAERVITNSEATAAAFVAAGGRPSLTRVVYNGIEVRAPSNAAVERVRSELGNGATALVGLFGRLTHWKGQHVAIEAAALLPGIHLILVGAPLFGEEAYERELRQRVQQAGLESRVCFLGFREDIAELMAAMDVIVHTSVAPEPFGRVIVEGMLAGKPLVASIGGGVGEIVHDGINGILVPPGQPERLADAIGKLLGNELEASKLAENGRHIALQRFTVPAMVQNVRAVVAEAMPKGQAAPAK